MALNLGIMQFPLGLGAASALVGLYFLYKRTKSTTPGSTGKGQATPQAIVEKPLGPKIDVYFGSQTGTAEEFSKILAQEGRKHGFDMKALDLEHYDPAKLKGSVSIFLVATYGEGDPTDNARAFHKWIVEEATEGDLEGMEYAVFGLGNMQYEHYNSFAKLLDAECSRLGGKRIFQLGLGDDDKNIQEDFEMWTDQLFPALSEHFGLIQSSSTWAKEGVQYKLKVALYENENEAGMFLRTKSVNKMDQHNIVQMAVTCNRELYQGGDRSCRHVELDISNLGVHYETGDHVAVYAENDPELVEGLSQRLSADLNSWIVVEDEDGSVPFPCPCTVRTALTRYLDINHGPSKSLLVALAQAATSDDEKKRLLFLADKENKDACYSYIVQGLRNVLDVLRDYPSVTLSLAQLVELMPRLQPRYYSISSASVVTPSSVHVTAVVVKERTSDGRTFKGVCTNFLQQLPIGAHVSGFLRTTPFKLPPSPATPVIMIGAGTGLAPLRGMYLHLNHLQKQGAVLGHNVLIFGCRRQNEDLLYGEEIAEMRKQGTLSSVYFALSRQDEFKKVYVQNRVDEHGVQLLKLIDEGAYIYVCGSVSMARDVKKALLQSLIFLRGQSGNQAEATIETLTKDGRYLQDVW